jgi:hypothetical protein
MRREAWILALGAASFGAGCGAKLDEKVASHEAAAAPLVEAVTLPAVEGTELPPVSSDAARLVVQPAGLFLDVTPVLRARLGAGQLTEDFLSKVPLPPDANLLALEDGELPGRGPTRPDARVVGELAAVLQKLDSASTAAERSQHGTPSLVLYADASIPAATIRDLVFTGETGGYAVQIAVRVGSSTQAIHLAPPREEVSLGATLNLRLFVAPEGHRVSGSGGNLTPGCAEVAAPPAITIPRSGSGYDFAALRSCLELVKMRFETDRHVTVRAHPALPHEDLVRTFVANIRPRSAGELFPEITLGRDPPIAVDVPE